MTLYILILYTITRKYNNRFKGSALGILRLIRNCYWKFKEMVLRCKIQYKKIEIQGTWSSIEATRWKIYCKSYNKCRKKYTKL
jgi:hypothetical protein